MTWARCVSLVICTEQRCPEASAHHSKSECSNKQIIPPGQRTSAEPGDQSASAVSPSYHSISTFTSSMQMTGGDPEAALLLASKVLKCTNQTIYGR